MIERRKTGQIDVKGIKIGGNAPIAIQSMTKTDTRDVKATLKQLTDLKEAKCDLIRLAIPDFEAVDAFKKIAAKSPLPLVADIHFDYKLALKAIENGASKIRFNPGNIGSEDKVKTLVKACKKNKIPIRIGVNAGSLEKSEEEGEIAERLVNSALKHVKILEREDFFDICISLKSSDPITTIKANQLIAKKLDYPLHLGVTEAGMGINAVAKSACGLAPLLACGIGDTIRISLSADPSEEVKIAQEILQSLNLRRFHREFISCPTCGRTEVDLIEIAREVEEKTKDLPANLTIAVMGCIVNGPGEAKHADYALVGGKKFFAIFKKGQIIKKVKEKEALGEFLKIINGYNFT